MFLTIALMTSLVISLSAASPNEDFADTLYEATEYIFEETLMQPLPGVPPVQSPPLEHFEGGISSENILRLTGRPNNGCFIILA